MAGSVNKVILIGNLGAKPELKVLPSGQALCELRLATNDVYTDKAGVKQEKVEWHRIVVWGKQAENCAKYLDKGRSIYVEGRLQTRSWDDKDGNKKYMTEVVAERVQFLGGGAGAEGGERARGGEAGRSYSGPSGPSSGPAEAPPSDFGSGGEDDIPF